MLPRVQVDHIGVLGHSRGSAAAITTVTTGTILQAVVAIAGYPENARLDRLRTPILILQGTADETVNVEEARTFEGKLQALGKTYEVHYYEGGTHNIAYDAPWHDDVVQRSTAFFKKYLVP